MIASILAPCAFMLRVSMVIFTIGACYNIIFGIKGKNLDDGEKFTVFFNECRWAFVVNTICFYILWQIDNCC